MKPAVVRLTLLALLVAAGCATPPQTPNGRGNTGVGQKGKPFPHPDQPQPIPTQTPSESASPSPTATPEADVTASPAPTSQSPTPGPSATASPTPMASATPSPQPTEAAPTARPTTLPRSAADRPDDSADYQLHLVYAVPADGTDRGYDADGSISRSAQNFDDWFYNQTDRKQRLRFDRSNGSLDISFVTLPQTDATYAAYRRNTRDALERDLKAQGFNHAKKLYVVYYDGSNPEVCGGAAWPPDLPGTVGALYLKGTPNCDDRSFDEQGDPINYREAAMYHEVFHCLGFVPRNAPHHTREGHTSFDPADHMYTGDSPWTPRVLDFEHDIYDHGVAGRLDLAKSAFLTPSRDGAAPPPSWTTSVNQVPNP